MRIWPYLVTMWVLAYTVGTLFQRAETTGVALFRMFGTIGIVVLGILAGIVYSLMQSEAARRELIARLRNLRGVEIREVPDRWRRRAPRVEAILAGADGTVYVVGTSLASNFRGARHVRRVQRDAAELRRRVDELRRSRADQGERGNVVGLLVLLRRKAGPKEDAAAAAHGTVVANVEQLHPDLFLPADVASPAHSPAQAQNEGEREDEVPLIPSRRGGEGDEAP